MASGRYAVPRPRRGTRPSRSFSPASCIRNLRFPIGVIKSAWGGKPVETFTSREALTTLPGTKKLVDDALESDEAYDDQKAQTAYLARLDQWQAAAAESRKQPADQRKRLPRKPAKPKRPLDTEGRPGVLFNSMIHPFVGYTMRGAIWYQGEANAKSGAVPYDQTLPLMINDWRERWNDDFSFYFVQLANFRSPSTQPGTPGRLGVAARPHAFDSGHDTENRHGHDQ